MTLFVPSVPDPLLAGRLFTFKLAAHGVNRFVQSLIWFLRPRLGRRVAVSNALEQVTHSAYDAEGRLSATWGATYPVAYEYDEFAGMRT